MKNIVFLMTLMACTYEFVKAGELALRDDEQFSVANRKFTQFVIQQCREEENYANYLRQPEDRIPRLKEIDALRLDELDKLSQEDLSKDRETLSEVAFLFAKSDLFLKLRQLSSLQKDDSSDMHRKLRFIIVNIFTDIMPFIYQEYPALMGHAEPKELPSDDCMRKYIRKGIIANAIAYHLTESPL